MTEIQTEVQAESQAEALSEPQKLANNKEIIAYLADKFPLCFSLEGEAKPIKIGLFQDLAEALKDDPLVSKTQLRHALRQYTSNWRYLHGCREGAVRVDLQGNPAGILEQEHVEHAARQLSEAKAKFAEKRAAEKAANAKAAKKRPVRNKMANKQNSTDKESQKSNKKTFARNEQRKPKIVLNSVDMAGLQKGSHVKVKVGDNVKRAVVLELVKDGARVELENGLIISVTPDRLFA